MKKIDIKHAVHNEWYFICSSDGVLRYVHCRFFYHNDIYGKHIATTKEFYTPDGLLFTIDHAVDYIFEVENG